MSEATVRGRGRITIPVDIRKTMGLTAGTRVVFARFSDGTTVMRAKTRSILNLRGTLKPKRGKREVAIRDM